MSPQTRRDAVTIDLTHLSKTERETLANLVVAAHLRIFDDHGYLPVATSGALLATHLGDSVSFTP